MKRDLRTPLGRLLLPPPRGLSPDIARLIDALAREAARRDHMAENPAMPLAAQGGTAETLGADAPDAA